MAYVFVDTKDGPQRVRVCDWCKTVCIPHPERYCTPHCRQMATEAAQEKAYRGHPNPEPVDPKPGSFLGAPTDRSYSR